MYLLESGVVYYVLLKPNETIMGDSYWLQIDVFEQSLEGQQQEFELKHDNSQPHVAIPVKNCLESLKWNILSHLPYLSDIAPSDYHLFQSMTHVLQVESFIASKDQLFFQCGICNMLPERWAKVASVVRICDVKMGEFWKMEWDLDSNLFKVWINVLSSKDAIIWYSIKSLTMC